jgi:hypothetical protein
VRDDPELVLVADRIAGIDRAEERMARILRGTYDQIYDGVHTGRYRWDQLRKTEKTHFGSLVEINLQREFDFEDGTVLDFSIAGVETDCKFSQENYGWMIPIEAVGQLCLVITADDARAQWSAGLVRPQDSLLGAPNRDRKRRLTAEGRESMVWLWRDSVLPSNVLLQIPRPLADSILELSSGQKRLNELFRRVQRQVIPRGTVATVAQQDDYMKRVRSNGGARTQLRDEGIVIFGHYGSHAKLAADLGLPVPTGGESLSVRLAPSDPGRGVVIDDSWWRIASADDPVTRAPELPGP